MISGDDIEMSEKTSVGGHAIFLVEFRTVLLS